MLAIDFGTSEKIFPCVLCPFRSRLSSLIPFQNRGLLIALWKTEPCLRFTFTTKSV